MDIKKYFVDFYNDFKHDEQKRNRVLILFLIFIGLCSVVLGFSNTKQTLKKPFIDEEKDAITNVYDTYDKLKAEGKIKDDTSSGVVKNNTTTISNPTDVASKNIDTDGDGLSDYDEINVFKTSAFLKDSDGDGLSDYDEVKAGTDPNCSTGKDCSASTVEANTVVDNSKNTVNALDVSKMDVKQARIELEKIIPENLKPMLASMSDEDVKSLMSQLYEGTVASKDSATTSNTTTTNTNITGTTSNYKAILKSKLPQFTAAQISTIKEMNEVDVKKLLLDSNIADESLLSQFKTGELKLTVLGE